MTSVRLRPLAEQDLVDRTRRYLAEAGDEVARRFFDGALATLDAIGSMPGTGALLPELAVGVAGVRFRRITGFPCGWCYLTNDDHVDVVRLLADAQDLPSRLSDELDH